MGIIPLQFKDGESSTSLGLSGEEKFSIKLPADLKPLQTITVDVRFFEHFKIFIFEFIVIIIISFQVDDGRKFDVIVRFDTEVDLTYFKNGGILNYMVRKIAM